MFYVWEFHRGVEDYVPIAGFPDWEPADRLVKRRQEAEPKGSVALLEQTPAEMATLLAAYSLREATPQ